MAERPHDMTRREDRQRQDQGGSLRKPQGGDRRHGGADDHADRERGDQQADV
jgi:hypothetical protein